MKIQGTVTNDTEMADIVEHSCSCGCPFFKLAWVLLTQGPAMQIKCAGCETPQAPREPGNNLH